MNMIGHRTITDALRAAKFNLWSVTQDMLELAAKTIDDLTRERDRYAEMTSNDRICQAEEMATHWEKQCTGLLADLTTAKGDANARASDRDRLHAELVKVTAERDTAHREIQREVQCRLQNVRVLIEADLHRQKLEKIVGDMEIERDQLRKALVSVQPNHVSDLSRLLSRTDADVIRDDAGRQWQRLCAPPRYFVERTMRPGPDPRQHRFTPLFQVRDRTVKMPFMVGVHKSVACSRELETADKICAMLNGEV